MDFGRFKDLSEVPYMAWALWEKVYVPVWIGTPDSKAMQKRPQRRDVAYEYIGFFGPDTRGAWIPKSRLRQPYLALRSKMVAAGRKMASSASADALRAFDATIRAADDNVRHENENTSSSSDEGGGDSEDERRPRPADAASISLQEQDINDSQKDSSSFDGTKHMSSRAGWVRGRSQYMGVSWHSKRRYWFVQSGQTYLGAFHDEEEAARKYDEYASRNGKALNFPLRSTIGDLETGAIQGMPKASAPRKRSRAEPMNIPTIVDEPPPDYSSQFRGVIWNHKKLKWHAVFCKKSLGFFEYEDEAARRYDDEALRHGEMSSLNFPREYVTGKYIDGVPTAKHHERAHLNLKASRSEDSSCTSIDSKAESEPNVSSPDGSISAQFPSVGVEFSVNEAIRVLREGTCRSALVCNKTVYGLKIEFAEVSGDLTSEVIPWGTVSVRANRSVAMPVDFVKHGVCLKTIDLSEVPSFDVKDRVEVLYEDAWYSATVWKKGKRGITVVFDIDDTYVLISTETIAMRVCHLDRCHDSARSGAPLFDSKLPVPVMSSYRGVVWDNSSSKWGAFIHINGESTDLGSFVDEVSAAKRYDEYAVKFDKPLNFEPASGALEFTGYAYGDRVEVQHGAATWYAGTVDKAEVATGLTVIFDIDDTLLSAAREKMQK